MQKSNFLKLICKWALIVCKWARNYALNQHKIISIKHWILHHRAGCNFLNKVHFSVKISQRNLLKIICKWADFTLYNYMRWSHWLHCRVARNFLNKVHFCRPWKIFTDLICINLHKIIFISTGIIGMGVAFQPD